MPNRAMPNGEEPTMSRNAFLKVGLAGVLAVPLAFLAGCGGGEEDEEEEDDD